MASWATLFALILAKGIVVLGIVLLLQAGQVSFGHAMFFATGAYAAAFWGKFVGGGDILLYIVLGGISSTIIGLIVGLFVVRYREIFFGMLNLAFSMVLWSLLEKMFHYTNGADGIRVARPGLLGFTFTPETFQYVILYVSLAIAIIGVLRRAALSRQSARPHAAGHQVERDPARISRHVGPPRAADRLRDLGVARRHRRLAGRNHPADRHAGVRLLDQVRRVRVHRDPRRRRPCVRRVRGSRDVRMRRFYAAAHLADSWQLILGVVLIVIILYAPNGLIGLRQRYGQAKQGGH